MMIKVRLILLCGLLASSAGRVFSAPVDETKEPFPTVGVVTDDRVRLRAAPNLDSATVEFLRRGQHLEVVGHANHLWQLKGQESYSYWYHVKTADSKEGWVYSLFVESYANHPAIVQWAALGGTAEADSNHGSRFTGVALDASGNAFAVGSFNGHSEDFGGIHVNGPGDLRFAVLIQYDLSGNASGSKTVVSAAGDSTFDAVASDAAGNLYVVGYLSSSGQYQFDDNVSVDVSEEGGGVIVKYDAKGNGLWARAVSGGDSFYDSVAVDPSGNVYVAGYLSGQKTCGFGNNVSVTGIADKDKNNVLLVKYDSSGSALWARTLQAGTGGAAFLGVAVDSSGNVFAAGGTHSRGKYGFGKDVSAAGSSDTNTLLVCYDTMGNARWARTQTAGPAAEFESVGVVGSVGVAVAGVISQPGKLQLGANVSASCPDTGTSGLVAEYGPDGTPRWAASLGPDKGDVDLASLAVIPGKKEVYAAGSDGDSAVLAEFDESGSWIWTRVLDALTPRGSGGKGSLAAVAANALGTVYTVGKTWATNDTDYSFIEKY